MGNVGKIKVDFTQGKMRYRFAHLSRRTELLIKAIGWRQNAPLHVFDTTAGFGKDAFLMGACGCQVTLFERVPVVLSLLKQGLHQATFYPPFAATLSRLTLLETCAIDFLSNASFSLPDVIYCDPMFPERKKSAAVKKEMQFLQATVGEDNDAQQLVTLSLQKAKKRVVVKRSALAPSFFPQPDFMLKGKSFRFDIYLCSGEK